MIINCRHDVSNHYSWFTPDELELVIFYETVAEFFNIKFDVLKFAILCKALGIDLRTGLIILTNYTDKK